MKTSWARLEQLEQNLRRRYQELSKNNYFALSVKAQEREGALRKEMTPIADPEEFQRRFDETPERKEHLQAVSELRGTQEAIQRLQRDILEELVFVHSGNKKAQIALQLLKEAQDVVAFLRILARLRASRNAKVRNRRQGAKREHVSRPEALGDQKSSLAKRSAQQAADPVHVAPEAGSQVPQAAHDGVPSPAPGLATPGQIKAPAVPDGPSAIESQGPAAKPRLANAIREPSAKPAPAQTPLAARLKKLKDESNLTWDTIAKEAHVSRRWLLDIAAGKSPSKETRKTISDYFAGILKRPIQF
jgi:hypothetical protein